MTEKYIGVNAGDGKNSMIAGDSASACRPSVVRVRAPYVHTRMHAFFIVAFKAQHTSVSMRIDALFTVRYNFAFHARHKPFRALPLITS